MMVAWQRVKVLLKKFQSYITEAAVPSTMTNKLCLAFNENNDPGDCFFSLLKNKEANCTMTFGLVTRRPYCPGGPKKLCFTTLSLIPMVSITRLGVVKQSSFGLPGQYRRHVTRANVATQL